MNCLLLINLWFFLWELLPGPPLNNPPFQFVRVSDTLTWQCRTDEKKVFSIEFIILEGYHIQSNYVLDDNLIPTAIVLTEIPPDIELGDAEFPEPADFKLYGSDVHMKVFHNKMIVGFPAKIKNEASTGSFNIEGYLHYQVCDSMKCYFPRDLPFTINLIIKE